LRFEEIGAYYGNIQWEAVRVNALKNAERIRRFIWKRKKELFTKEFYATVFRVINQHFNYFDRVSSEQFHENLRIIEKRPWNIHLETTNICNSNCVFCAYPLMKRQKKIMSSEIFNKVLDDYCKIGGGEISFLGDAEPTTDPAFIARIKAARKRPQIKDITTITNGILFDKIGFENFLTSGINRVQISVGAFDKENILNLLKTNSELGCPVEIKIAFRTTLSMKQTLNLVDYQEMKKYPHKVEFNTDFHSWGGKVKKENLPGGIIFREPVPLREQVPCFLLYDGPIIYPDGKFGLCHCQDIDADSELVVGNIMNHSLLELWQSEKVKCIRERFYKKDYPALCRNCPTYINLDFYKTKKGKERADFIKTVYGDSSSLAAV